jgi:hypothetical protein
MTGQNNVSNVSSLQHPNSMVLASARIEISFDAPQIVSVDGKKKWELVNLKDAGLARGISIAKTATKQEIKADNGTVPISGYTGFKATVSFNLLERHLPFLSQVMRGIVKLTPLGVGEKRSFTDDHASGVFNKGDFIALKNSDYRGDSPTDIVVKQGAETLAVSKDYEVVKRDSGWAIKLLEDTAASDNKSAVTTKYNTRKPLSIAYSVTPVRGWQMGSGAGGILNPVAIRLTNRRKADDGRVISRVFEFPYGFYANDDGVSFKSKDDSDSVAECQMKFEFSPHPDFEIDQELESESFMREIQEV